MDWATIIGIAAGVLLLGTRTGGDPGAFWDPASMLFVIVGGLAAALISFPARVAWQLVPAAWRVLRPAPVRARVLLERLVGFAETARREGILALEQGVDPEDGAFMSTAVRLAVDGTEPNLIQDILEAEVSTLEIRHRQRHRLLRALGRNLALCGVLGALMVLVRQQGDGLSGPALAAAMALPVLYGGLLGGLVAFPMARKLAERSEEELLGKRLIMRGVMSIQAGDNPRIVEHRLSMYLPPADRPSDDYDLYGAPKPRRWWQRRPPPPARRRSRAAVSREEHEGFWRRWRRRRAERAEERRREAVRQDEDEEDDIEIEEGVEEIEVEEEEDDIVVEETS